MIFRRAPQRYGVTPVAETPYQKAGQLWDERDGAVRAQAYNWRLACFGALLIAGGLAAGNVWQAGQSRVTPYVVEVDRLGEVRAVGPAEQAYQPGDLEISAHLRRFIVDVRSLSTDPIIVKERWFEAYDFASSKGKAFLNAYSRAENPVAGIGERSTSVQVTSVVRVSPSTFQVEWEERDFERGVPTTSERWTAMLTIVRQKPRTKAELTRNPLGIFVDAIDWQQKAEIRPLVSRPVDPAPSLSAAQPQPSPAPVPPETGVVQ